jgi:hypothetical protein
MFSVREKREIAEAVQKILRATHHPELPDGEIQFHLHVGGKLQWQWADIRNNGAVPVPDVNPHNERQDGLDGGAPLAEVVVCPVCGKVRRLPLPSPGTAACFACFSAGLVDHIRASVLKSPTEAADVENSFPISAKGDDDER